MNSWIFYILSFLILSACVMDVTSRKVSNFFVVFSAFVCFLLHLFVAGSDGVLNSLTSFVITFFALLPLYLLRVLGGGDFKFFVALSFILSPLITTDILLLSIVWGAIIGILQSAFSGTLKELLFSIYFRIKGWSTLANSVETSTFKIPYTIAYLLGWLTWYKHGGVL